MHFPSVSVAAEAENILPFAANFCLPFGQKISRSLQEAAVSTVVADAGGLAAVNAAVAVVFAEEAGVEVAVAAAATVAVVVAVE